MGKLDVSVLLYATDAVLLSNWSRFVILLISESWCGKTKVIIFDREGANRNCGFSFNGQSTDQVD